jgi:hypothetical protein
MMKQGLLHNSVVAHNLNKVMIGSHRGADMLPLGYRYGCKDNKEEMLTHVRGGAKLC